MSFLSLPPLYLALWALLAVLTAALVVLSRTEWGRERPTPRYVLLSIVAHLALFCLATTVRFMSAPSGDASESPIKVRIVMATPSPPADTPVPVEPPVEPKPEAVPTEIPEAAPADEPAPIEPQAQSPIEPPLDPPPLEPAPVEPSPAEPISAPPLLPAPDPVVETIPSEPTLAETAEPLPPINHQPTPAVEPRPPKPPEPPEPTPAVPVASRIDPPTVAPQPATPYAARQQTDRLKVVEQEGGSRATEDAVASALAWLAAAQSPDGRWDASRWSAGRETRTLGHDRRGAGAQADTGITGLALLAMLGAGHTQSEGPYAANIEAGIRFLARTQTSDGGLTGPAALYAQTYCHSMATFALAEALAATEDQRLRNAVERAVAFLVARQDRSGGGWRYRPGDEGDMSQMGWIIMALRSAELADVRVPPTVWTSIERFVRATRRGEAGGLACYQPRGPASRTMTAESLYCRQILGWPTFATPASEEAINHLLREVPGRGRGNLYYWYYASLALHHERGAGRTAEQAWRVWNGAMSRELVESQVASGPDAGSWRPDTMWAGYGGRVYSTAMGAMCLEVYYRYDADEISRDPWLAARPSGPLR